MDLPLGTVLGTDFVRAFLSSTKGPIQSKNVHHKQRIISLMQKESLQDFFTDHPLKGL